jgi:AraC-like DNA-binding protein
VTETAARGSSPHLAVHLRRARDHVDRHVADDLDLDRLARVAGVSKYHFVRSSEAAYGEGRAARRVRELAGAGRAPGLHLTPSGVVRALRVTARVGWDAGG